MVAGTNTRRAPAPHTPSNTDEITQWICHAPTWNQGASGGFPSGVTSCPDYPYFNGAIHFPHCWNGNAFDQAHPSAHMSYPIGDIQAGSCPSTHPIRLPHIFMENDFYLENVKGQFQTDSFVLANGDPTGFGWHADFVCLQDASCLVQSLTMTLVQWMDAWCAVGHADRTECVLLGRCRILHGSDL